MTHSVHAHDQAEIQISEADVERQAYLDEAQLESSQFGVGRLFESED